MEYSTPFGPITLTCNESEQSEIIRWLEDYFAGLLPTWRPAYVLQGSDFQKKVWHILEQVPYGKTTTYGSIARKISPTLSPQAVGQAVHRNPLPILIPCHRVIASNGCLTGYAYGIKMKGELLDFEKMQLQEIDNQG